MYAVGIDGCSNGWLACFAEPYNFKKSKCIYSRHLSKLISMLPKKTFIIIDIPIGLEETKHIRECDLEARSFIGPRRHSVFAPPCLKASLANTYESANKLNKKITNYGLSKQTWMINERCELWKNIIWSVPALGRVGLFMPG